MPSYEETQALLDAALRQTYGDDALLIETHPDHLITRITPPDDEEPARYVRTTYTITDDAAALGEPADVENAEPAALSDSISLTYAVAGMPHPPAGAKAPPPYIAKLPMQKQRQFCEVWNNVYATCIAKGGSDPTCHASAFAQANGVIKADDSGYATGSIIGDPITGTGLQAGEAYLFGAYTPANDREVIVPAGTAQLDNADDLLNAQVDSSVWFSLRLADTAASTPLPVWQPYHIIGKWSIPHGVSGPIQFTKEIGDSIIKNFHAGVIRRGVPLDERHSYEQNGIAHAWAEDYRWGKDGEGLPGAPEPSGSGPILYWKLHYLPTAEQLLAADDAGHAPYEHFSPQYTLNYVDKKTGTEYGPAALAGAMTNDGFIRDIRSMQGRPAMPWVNPASIAASDITIITDGLRPYHSTPAEGSTPVTTPQQTPAPGTQPGQQPPTPNVQPPQQPGQQPPTGTPRAPQQDPAQPPGTGVETNRPADIQLAERLRTVEVQLAEERAAHEQERQALAAERQRAHERNVELFLSDYTYGRGEFGNGTTAGYPSVAQEARPWLLAAGQRAPAVIRLAEGDGPPDTNFHEGIRRILRAGPRMPIGSVTHAVDRRPQDIALEEQVATAEENFGRQLAAQRHGKAGQNGTTPGQNGSAPAGTNGSTPHS